MGRKDCLLLKEYESIAEFDKRISKLPYQHIGYAFFERSNYNPDSHKFSVYIVWNGSINSKLEDPYPETGFVIDCNQTYAECFIFENQAIPVMANFMSFNGHVCIKDLLIRIYERNFKLEYDGSNTNIPEKVYFMKTSEIDEDKVNLILNPEKESDFNADIATTFDKISLKESTESENFWNFKNSFKLNDSFDLTSSFKMNNSFKLNSSFKLNNLFKLNSSFKLNNLFNLNSSFNKSKEMFGSFNYESFIKNQLETRSSFVISSFNRFTLSSSSYNTSSFNASSFNMNSSYDILSRFNLGSYYNCLSNESFNKEIEDSFPFESLLKEIFGIGYMGYGLDLI